MRDAVRRVVPGTQDPQYHRAGCGRPLRTLVSLSTSRYLQFFGAQNMLKHYAERAWRLAITVGPLVAIALTLVAGQKWR